MVSRTTSRCANSASPALPSPQQRKFRGPRWRPLGRRNHREKLTGVRLVPIMMMSLPSGRSPALPVDTHMFRPFASVTHTPQNMQPKVCSSRSRG